MGYPPKSGRNRVDFYLRELLAMAVFDFVALATFFLEHDELVALNVFLNGGTHRCAADDGYTERNPSVGVNQMNFREAHRVALIGCQPVDEDQLTFLNFELLTGDGNDCEHVIE